MNVSDRPKGAASSEARGRDYGSLNCGAAVELPKEAYQYLGGVLIDLTRKSPHAIHRCSKDRQ
jgi:hypothetical protein